MELLSIHMQSVHNESDNNRMTRIAGTVEKSLHGTESLKITSWDCTECGLIFLNREEQIDHYNKQHKRIDIVCELCDKVFINRVEKSSHKMFVHKVSTETLKCEYCGEACEGLNEICKHITAKHGDLFPKKPDRSNMCDICFKRFSDANEVAKHMKESHSPDSFYEPLQEDITGVCRICKQKVSSTEIENHYRTEHMEETKKTDCSICDQTFNSKMELSSHTLTNHREAIDNINAKQSPSIKEEGEVDAEIIINDDQQSTYKCGSWGGAEKYGFSFGGKRKEFGQAVLDIQRLFYTNKEYNLDGVKFALVSKEKDEKGSGQTYTIEIEKDGEKGKSSIKV